jgi:hypothetical protein
MPKRPTWMRRIPEIIQVLESLDCPIVDRKIIEEAFCVQRRTANALLHRFKIYCLNEYLSSSPDPKLAKTLSRRFVVADRADMIARLMRIEATKDYRQELVRREHVRLEIEKARDQLEEIKATESAKKFILRPTRDSMQKRMKDILGRGITLERGKLTLEYFGFEDLVLQLFELSQALTNDLEKFRSKVESLESLSPPVENPAAS